MKTSVYVFVVALIVLVLTAVPASAHHGTAISYEMQKTITLNGTVTQFKWVNPHVALYFDVKGDDGQVVSWSAEATSPYFWAQRGFNKNAVKPGDQITITLQSLNAIHWEYLGSFSSRSHSRSFRPKTR